MRRIIAIILMIALVFNVLPFSVVSAVTESDEFIYYIDNNETATIVSYSGNATEVIIPGEFEGYPLKKISNYCFGDNEKIEKVVVPEGVEIISWYAFFNCSNLVEVVLPESVHELDYGCFENCHKLEKVTLPMKLTVISSNLFSKCKALKHIEIPYGVTRIRMNAFAGTGIEKIEIPGSVKCIESVAFTTPIGNITIPGSVTEIQEDAILTDSPNDVTIISYVGSVAESYANLNGHSFSSMGYIYKELEYGDVTFDGKVNIRDVTEVQKYCAKMREFLEHELTVADYNKDGKVNINDCTEIQKFLIKL